jgi:SsrA-binding protein
MLCNRVAVCSVLPHGHELCAVDLARKRRRPVDRLAAALCVQYAESVAKKSKKSAAAAAADKNERVIAENRKARHNYHVLDTLECGIALVGSEVKSLRGGQLSLDEAYGRVEDGEVWLVGANIAEYAYSHALNHVPKRRRKLLLHRREVKKFAGQAYEKGLTLVPLKMYFKAGRAKVLLGICRGKQSHDKRDSLKKRDAQRDIDRAMRKR